MPVPSPVSVRTVHDEVYRQLRVWITSGEISPGSKLSMRMLADLCGVSTTPVREALKQLQADGLVVSERRTLRVTELDPREIHQVFQIRLRLELLANEWAIAVVTDEDIRELEELLEQMTVDPAQWRSLNQEFHRRFYDCTRSPHLLELIQTVWDRVEPYLAIYASTVGDFDEAHRQHGRLLTHIRARDLAALDAELVEHLAHTERTIVQALGGGHAVGQP